MRRRSGTGRSAVAEDGGLGNHCPNQLVEDQLFTGTGRAFGRERKKPVPEGPAHADDGFTASRCGLVLPHRRMLPRIAPLGATKCPAFWPFGSTRSSLRDHNFTSRRLVSSNLTNAKARSNAGFPDNHHARLEFGLITCLDSSWPLSFVLAPISMMAWIWDQADHRPVRRSQACAGLRDWRDLCLYLPVQHHQDCAVCSWRRQRNPHQPSLLLIIQYTIHIY